jgi:hypothetical protein
MLVLTLPCNHDRLNAVIYEVLHLNITGMVCVPGDSWDCYVTLGYLEKRLKRPVIATQCTDGSKFCVGDKTVNFTDDGVFISNFRLSSSSLFP